MEQKLLDELKESYFLIKEQNKLIEKLSAKIIKLERDNNDLKELLNRNSNNSSQPPSQSKIKPKNYRISSGKPSGGQKGHEGHSRKLVEEKEVDKIVYCELPKRCSCGGEILAEGDHIRHQVYELPIIELDVTEYKIAKGECCCCGQRHIAELPKGITWGITGAKLTSFMSQLSSRYRLSRRDVKEFLKEHLNFEVSLGTVFNKEKLVTTSLEKATDNLLRRIKKNPFLHVDETGHKRDAKKEWMWSVSTLKAAFFVVLLSRGKKAMKTLIGNYKGIVVSDRYSVYNHFCDENRQFCLAHLKRDFVRLSEKKDVVVRRIGKGLLKEIEKLFKKWHRFKNGELIREKLISECDPIKSKIKELLEQASYTAPELKAARFAKNLLEHFDSLWTFLYMEGVEPTNNQAERCLRRSVIWRKMYFCTRSKLGDLFVARTASIIATCRLQDKSVNQYLEKITKRYFEKNIPRFYQKLKI